MKLKKYRTLIIILLISLLWGIYIFYTDHGGIPLVINFYIIDTIKKRGLNFQMFSYDSNILISILGALTENHIYLFFFPVFFSYDFAYLTIGYPMYKLNKNIFESPGYALGWFFINKSYETAIILSIYSVLGAFIFISIIYLVFHYFIILLEKIPP